jgi:hypothetical protein
MIKIMIFYCVSFFSFLLLKPKNLKLKTLLAFIIYNLTFNIALGQTYPVQISTQLIPPYSGYLPDYADPTAQNLKVILQFNDFTVPSYNLKLKFEIKGNGFSLVTKSIYNPPPLSLQPGQPLLLSGIDIAPYLSSNNLDFIGINQSQYEQRMALPEGYYSICVKAYDYYSGSPVQVSNEACAQGWFTLSNPPLLNLPLCNTVVTPLQPQNLLFSWTPVNLGSPNSAFNTSYLFELWEMRPDSTVNPNQLVQNTQPIFSQATTFNNLNYGIADPPLNLYYKYAWRVRVIDGSGRDWFINNGFSQVCTFYYGSISNTLGNNNGLKIQAEALDYTTGKATWTLQTIYNAYQFEVRKANTQNWFPYTTTSGNQQIDNLEPNNTYECRVKGFGNDFNSEYSNIVQFTTPNAPTYNCDQTAPIYSLNTTPLAINKALPGITLRSGQFDIKIKTIEPSTNGLGWYKGSGYALMFGLLPVPVTFSNVFIDDKLRHQQGLIEAVTQGIKNWMVQFDIEDAEENATYTEGTLDSVYINGNQYCYTTIQNQTPVCTTLDTTNKITVIRDGDGNQYVVNAGPPPTVTGPTNYLNTSNDNLAASDTLKVEFIASPNQNFGFDGKEYAAFIEGYECIKLNNGKNYFVPNKSIGINQNDKVYASCTINNLVAANLSFKTLGGATLIKTSVNPTVFEITNIPANANCIYAWYNNKKIGKLNVLSLNKVSKKVVLVSVNNASLPLGVSQMGAALNAIYKQANTNFTITTVSNFTFNLGNDGSQEADATLLKKYSLEMRALRDAYKAANSNYDKNAYYVFVVPNFSDPQLEGYMVRGRAVGFISATSNSNRTVAGLIGHELAHGAFGLEHTFPSAKKASTNNLLDYGSGEQLVKAQWEQIQNPGVIFNWLDEEEDGSLQLTNCTPAQAIAKYTTLQQKYTTANLEGGWSSNTDLTGILNRANLLNEINNTCILTMFKMPATQRKVILNYLIDNGLNTTVNASAFNYIIYHCSDVVFDSLLTYFSNNNYAKLKNVITSSAGDAYSSIMKKLAQKLTANPSGPSTGARLLALFSATDYDKRVLGMGSNGKPYVKVSNVDFLSNGKIEVTLKQLDWTFNFTGILSNPMGGFSYLNFGSYNDYDEISPKILLNPFDLVVYTDFTNISSVAADGVVTRKEQVIVPAIYLKYIDDKQFEHNITTVSMVALDMFVIATSGGVALASKASWLRRAWAAVEVAGAAGNIEVNTGDLGSDPDLIAVVEKYNNLQFLLGIKNLGKMTFAKAINGTKIVNSLENLKKAARNDFIALAFKYNVKLTNLGNNPKAKIIIDARERIVKLFNITNQEVNAMKAGTYVYGAGKSLTSVKSWLPNRIITGDLTNPKALLGVFEKEMPNGTWIRDTKNALVNIGFPVATVNNFKTVSKDGYKMLNTPQNFYQNADQFWTQYNKPWLDDLVTNKADVVILSNKFDDLLKYQWDLDPLTNQPIYRKLPNTNTRIQTGFGREIEYMENLVQQGKYQWDPVNGFYLYVKD